MLLVGLTGGIGAGKSTVSARLGELGAVVVDADAIAREVVRPGTPALAEIAATFGPAVLQADGTLDRAALGRIVFADDAARTRLNAITHPRIAATTAERMASAPTDAVVVHDVALLVENRMGARYQLVVVVDAPRELRVARLVRTRGMTQEDARARTSAQADDRERRAAADVLLDNTGPLPALLAEVDRLWRDRLVPFEANLRAGRPAPRPPSAAALTAADPPAGDPARSDPGPQAARLLARVRRAAGPDAVRMDHVGPTAVPGGDGGDVLDVQVVVRDVATAHRVAASLVPAGLVPAPGARWSDVAQDGTLHEKGMAQNADPARPVDCHVRPLSSPAWREALLLRDWLVATGGPPGDRADLGAATAWAAATGWTP